MRKVVQFVRRRVLSVFGFAYRMVAALFAKLSFASRVVAVASPHFFLVYRGDALAPVALSPELSALRVLGAIVVSFFFFVYFVWDTVSVAGRASKKNNPHTGDTDWDSAKAAMDDDDPSMMGSTAWLKQRARESTP